MEKKIIVSTAYITLVLLSFAASPIFGQRTRPPTRPKAPVERPQPAPTPAPAREAATPEQTFFNEGLKCPPHDDDCQISNYTKAINLGLATKEAFKNRGNAYSQRKDFDKALADYTKLIELDPNDASGYKSRGKLYLEIFSSPQAVNAAIRDLTSAIDLEPKDVEALKLRSSAYIKLTNYDKAKADLDRIASIEPNNVDVILGQAQMFLDTKQYDNAVGAFDRALAIKPSASTYLSRGNAYFASRKYDLAVADFSKAIEFDPKNAGAYDARAKTYLRSRKVDLATQDIDRAIELDPSRKNSLIDLAESLQQQTDYAGAAKIYDNLLTTNPDHTDFLIKRGILHIWLEDYDAALRDISRAVDLAPHSSKTYEARCTLNSAMANRAAAIADCTKAIELNPMVEEPYLLRASAVSLQTGNFADYTAALNKMSENKISNANRVLATDPEDHEALYKRGIGYHYMKNYSLAIADLKKAIELQPDYIQAYQTLVSADMSQNIAVDPKTWKTKTGNFAVQLYSDALKSNPTSAAFLSGRAAAYLYYLEDYPRAIQEYEKAIEAGPSRPHLRSSLAQAHSELATAYVASKDYEKAVEQCSKAGEVDKQKGVSCFYFAMIKIPYEEKSTLKAQEFVKKGEVYAQHAIETFPDDHSLWKEMGNIKSFGYLFDPKYQEANKKSNYVKGYEIQLRALETALAYYLKCNLIKNGTCSQMIESQKQHIKIVEDGMAAQKAIKAQMRAATWGAVLNGANAILATLSAGTRTQQTPPDTAPLPSTQTPSPPANGVPTQSNSGSNTSDPDFPASMKGNVYYEQKRPDYTCIKQRWCWSQAQQLGITGVLWAGLGPVPDAGNSVDGSQGNSYKWHTYFWNNSNRIVEFKVEVDLGDGKPHWRFVSLTPGGFSSGLDWPTLVAAPQMTVRIAKMRSCSVFTKTTNGYRCDEQ